MEGSGGEMRVKGIREGQVQGQVAEGAGTGVAQTLQGGRCQRAQAWELGTWGGGHWKAKAAGGRGWRGG